MGLDPPHCWGRDGIAVSLIRRARLPCPGDPGRACQAQTPPLREEPSLCFTQGKKISQEHPTDVVERAALGKTLIVQGPKMWT